MFFLKDFWKLVDLHFYVKTSNFSTKITEIEKKKNNCLMILKSFFSANRLETEICFHILVRAVIIMNSYIRIKKHFLDYHVLNRKQQELGKRKIFQSFFRCLRFYRVTTSHVLMNQESEYKSEMLHRPGRHGITYVLFSRRKKEVFLDKHG